MPTDLSYLKHRFWKVKIQFRYVRSKSIEKIAIILEDDDTVD